MNFAQGVTYLQNKLANYSYYPKKSFVNNKLFLFIFFFFSLETANTKAFYVSTKIGYFPPPVLIGLCLKIGMEVILNKLY